ncbi:cupin domain-containing protein, partial [bacterium]|nr:cupin domain-containing protein [candidate division CSSED10-310 bacterium]
EECADAAGISLTMLTQVENGVLDPPIAVLLKLSRALGVSLPHLYGESERGGSGFLHTSGTRHKTIHRSGLGYAYSYQRLAAGKREKIMEPFLVRFNKSQDTADFYQHDGEEFLYLLEGELEYILDGKRVRLKKGDSIYLDPGIRHQVRCLGDIPAEALVVITNKMDRGARNES